jgi:acetate kinase
MMSKKVLVINCGSSSVKFALVDVVTHAQPITGLAEKLGSKEGLLNWKIDGNKQSRSIANPDHLNALQAIIRVLEENQFLNEDLVAVGHRLVHGAEKFHKSERITEQMLAVVESCNHLAPLHNPANIVGVRTAMKLLPHLPQVGVFDTAFHQTMPEQAYIYALPYEYYTKYGVRRYGFHGTSHRYVTQKAAAVLGKKFEDCALVSAHLGNGCSATAVLGGKSVDTTMGLTPLEGLVMGTRSGDIDPGLHAFLAKEMNCDVEEVTSVLNKKSGLLGISGISNDMRELIAASESGEKRATLAIDVFCYRLAKSIAGLAVPLGRLDALIFTGGIGENSKPIRAKVLNLLGVLGFKLDAVANENHGKDKNGIISQSGSTIAMVVPTDEEYVIASDTAKVIGAI